MQSRASLHPARKAGELLSLYASGQHIHAIDLAPLHILPSHIMSAYGTIAAPRGASQEPLRPRLYRLPDDSQNLAVVPLKREAIPHELAQHLADVRDELPFVKVLFVRAPIAHASFPLPSHLRLSSQFRPGCPASPSSWHIFVQLFNGIVREGRTYPQEEELSLQSFQVRPLRA